MWKELKSNLLAALIVSGIALGGAISVTGSQFFTSITGGSASFDLVDAGQLYVANNATIAKTLSVTGAANLTFADAGQYSVASGGGFTLAGESNTGWIFNGSNLHLQSGGASVINCNRSDGQCTTGFKFNAPSLGVTGASTQALVDAGQLYVANDATVAGTARVTTGLNVGGGGVITKIIPCPRIDWDFASIIPRPGFEQYTDKATCTGVSIGDPCFVGVTNATPQDGGSAWEDNVNFFAIARGVNQVQVVMLTASGDGGAMNPPDAGYLITCISNR